MNSLVLIVIVLFTYAAYGMEIHKHMTEAEKQAVFGVRSREMHKVDYQVLPVHHADTAKSKKMLQLQAFGRNISLYLERNNHLLFGSATPIFLARRKKSGLGYGNIEYTRYHYQLPKNFTLYHDRANVAALTAHKDKHGRTLFDGVMMDRKSGENLVIKPIPHRFHEEVLKQYTTKARNDIYTNYANDNFLGNFYSTYNPSVTPHVVMKEVYEGNPGSFGSLRSGFLDPNTNSIFSNSFTSSNVRVSSYNSQQSNPGLASSVRGTQYSSVQRSPPMRNPQYPSSATFFGNSEIPSIFGYNVAQSKPGVIYTPKSSGIPNSHRNPGYLDVPKNNRPLNPDLGFSSPQQKFGVPGSQNFRPNNVNTDQVFGNPLNTMNQKPSSAWRPTNRDPIIRPPTFGETNFKPVPESSMSKTFPEIVYPEILVIVDNDTFKVHNKNLPELLKYLAAFWNAVDLRYRELIKPKVRLNIAGLVVPAEPDVTPYLDQHLLDANTIRVDPALETMGKYFASVPDSQLVNYDVAVAITHRALGSFDEQGRFSNSTAGLAYMNGACKAKAGIAVAIVKDSGGCNGIISTVHELGHALGAPHDGEESRNVPGGPCDWEDGYLMSYKVKDSRAFHWSHCSKTAMQQYLRSIDAKCLRNKPEPGTPYPKPLPGRMLSRDKQCELIIGSNFRASPVSLNNCAILNCTKVTETRIGDQIFTQTLAMIPNNSPAEGTACGVKSICLDGKCVLDPDLLIES